MINSALSGVSALQTSQNRATRAEIDLSPRNPEISEGGGQDERETSIANLVRLNITVETALEQARQIKTQLAEQPFSIANDEPHFVFALVS